MRVCEVFSPKAGEYDEGGYVLFGGISCTRRQGKRSLCRLSKGIDRGP